MRHSLQELGPGGRVEGKPSEVMASNSSLASGALSPQSSDLALLRTANVSTAIFTFCHDSMYAVYL